MKKTSKILIAIIAFSFITGFFLHVLFHWEYDAKPSLFNWLGFNPSHKFRGKRAPNFKLIELHSGKVVTLKQHRGKIVLLDFWASWCRGCQKQLAILQNLYKDLALSKKVQFLTINIKETASQKQVRAFLKKRGLTFPVLLATQKVVQDYKIWFFPLLVVINSEGRIVYTGAEFHTEPKIRKILAKAAE